MKLRRERGRNPFLDSPPPLAASLDCEKKMNQATLFVEKKRSSKKKRGSMLVSATPKSSLLPCLSSSRRKKRSVVGGSSRKSLRAAAAAPGANGAAAEDDASTTRRSTAALALDPDWRAKAKPVAPGSSYPAKEHCSQCGLCDTYYVAHVKEACAFLGEGKKESFFSSCFWTFLIQRPSLTFVPLFFLSLSPQK